MQLQIALNKEYKAKLSVDGLAGAKTLAATPTLTKILAKNKPLTTSALQSLLKYHDCDCGKIDGVWGSKTDVAVKKFQTTKVGLKKADYEFTAKKKSWKKLLNIS